MSDHSINAPDPGQQYAPLAQWLYRLLAIAPQGTSTEQIPVGEDVSLPGEDYHVAFYPQIPNFAMALIRREPDASTRYAPLLLHLIGCPACHRSYLELYDALQAAESETLKPATVALRTTSSAGLATTSPKLLVFLCQLLIGQARAVLRQAHRDQSDQDAWARSLLQQAMQLSRYIMQGTLRQRALRDLVAVAGLYSTTAPSPPSAPSGPAALSYVSLVSNGSGTRGRPVVRRTEMLSRPTGQVRIELRADALEGSVTQQGEQLILHLVGLNESLRGKFLLISVLLGTLLEPVRWSGGNPYAIRSAGPVGIDGTLTTPLGATDLRLDNPEERNLIETLFKKLEIRPVA